MKPKANTKGDPNESLEKDRCQTPPYAVEPLYQYLPKEWRVWESACGKGRIVAALTRRGYDVVGTDILNGQNFFEMEPPTGCRVQVTNPPYSNPTKFQWIQRSYELGLPFALLMPVETIGAKGAQEPMSRLGVEIIWLSDRVNFEMPNLGFDGAGANYPVAWFTWGLNIGRQMTFAKIYPTKPVPAGQLRLFEEQV